MGERLDILLEAINRLNNMQRIDVTKVSHVYETEPVGGPKQINYLNAAVEVETILDAKGLLKVCLNTEKEMGRSRLERWGPRTIDIDILLYGDLIMKNVDLTIPHPLMHERGFVLQPLSDIAPEIFHPVIGLTIKDLMKRVGKKDITKLDNVKFGLQKKGCYRKNGT